MSEVEKVRKQLPYLGLHSAELTLHYTRFYEFRGVQDWRSAIRTYDKGTTMMFLWYIIQILTALGVRAKR
jgi:hypothetical protein